jgi:hypothetical protein
MMVEVSADGIASNRSFSGQRDYRLTRSPWNLLFRLLILKG